MESFSTLVLCVLLSLFQRRVFLTFIVEIYRHVLVKSGLVKSIQSCVSVAHNSLSDFREVLIEEELQSLKFVAHLLPGSLAMSTLPPGASIDFWNLNWTFITERGNSCLWKNKMYDYCCCCHLSCHIKDNLSVMLFFINCSHQIPESAVSTSFRWNNRCNSCGSLNVQQ